MEDGGAELLVEAESSREWKIDRQRVDLDVDFPGRTIRGSTEITILPLIRDLKHIRLHARQCRPTSVQIGGIASKWEHHDPYRKSSRLDKATVHQHRMLKERLQHPKSLRPNPEPTLEIALPPRLKIQELRQDSAVAASIPPPLQRSESDALAADTLLQSDVPQFAPIKLTIEFEVDSFRDGIHWVGCEAGDHRYPYLYTKLEPWAGNTSCIFPCLDDATSKCNWEIAIRCPRTLGDAFRIPKQAPGDAAADGDVEMTNGSVKEPAGQDDFFIELSDEDAALELTVLCVGDISDDSPDPEDESRHTITFAMANPFAARHVGFAIGPFEHADLTMSRTNEDELSLKGTAIKLDGYCLPGRSHELENTCFPLCQAVDQMSPKYGTFPFASYKFLFVDDLIHDTAAAAGFSICSNRLLFPQDIIEPLDRNTRILVRAVADQWCGVNIIPKEPPDAWAIAGIAGYMTDQYMKKLAGNNQYRWEQKLACDKVFELDADRPSIHQLGALLHIDPSVREFLDLKSALVLAILDRRLVKSSGSTGVARIINKIFLNAKVNNHLNGELSTQEFQRTCERLGHNKLESFFRQWVMGAGCPIFYVTQRFNKKKLVVEMTITQKQLHRQTKPPFAPNNFMREIKEHVQEVWAPETQNVFTGPMTIRIHEADGTPYEHIVDIKEPVTKLDIPYNTKYKRLKRSRRQKERAAAEGQPTAEGEDALLYSLGDVLDTTAEVNEWGLSEWTPEDEDKMSNESYEWIRMDADFEWIGKIHLECPLYMYVSQLQQDRDIVAQHESMQHLLRSQPHHVSHTILVRTLFDERYFHGIRVMAAEGLALLAKDGLLEVGQRHLMKTFEHFFCDEDSVMPRPNDFSNRISFIIQCAIPKAMAQLRDADNRVPRGVMQFFVDKLKFNDNSDNAFSDCHYVSQLMTCLSDSLVASHREVAPVYHFAFGEDEEPLEPENPDAEFESMAVGEIERYRRIDEWINTYQNVYSTTALQCLQKLTAAGVVKNKTKELVQYTLPTTAPNVRLEAFRCLIEMGLTKKKGSAMMRHLLHQLVDDPSPYFRDGLLRLLGEALGHIALDNDDGNEATATLPPATDGLVLEQEASNAAELRRIEATRRNTPEGAIEKLKSVLQHDEIFKKALWYAATSPIISIDEIAAFCDIAALIYPAVVSHTVVLKLPRPYKAVHQGHGKIRFYQDLNRPRRTKPCRGLEVEDYESLEGLGLRYTGPLSAAVKAMLKQRTIEEALRDQIARTEQNLATVQTQPPIQMPPPSLPPLSISTSGHGISASHGTATPKSGIKLSLAGSKRKQSVDLSTPNGGTPKTIKISNGASAGSAPGGSAGFASTPLPVKKIKPPTPSTPRTGKKIVIFSLGISASRRAQAIINAPPQKGRTPNLEASASSTPGTTKARTPSLPVPPSMQSPVAASTFTAPPPTMNVGGFRSYSGDAPASSPFSGGFTPTAAASPTGFAGSPPPSLTSLAAPPSQPPKSITSLSSSPPASGSVNGASMAPPPPKKKLTLKLSASKPASASASPIPTPSPKGSPGAGGSTGV